MDRVSATGTRPSSRIGHFMVADAAGAEPVETGTVELGVAGPTAVLDDGVIVVLNVVDGSAVDEALLDEAGAEDTGAAEEEPGALPGMHWE